VHRGALRAPRRQGLPLADVDRVVGAGVARWDQHVDEPLLQPGLDVVALAHALRDRAGHPDGQQQRPAALPAGLVAEAADGPLDVGEAVPQPVGLRDREVEGMPLPIYGTTRN
jgi:hypothetical protein